MNTNTKSIKNIVKTHIGAVIFLILFGTFFGIMGSKMGASNMVTTMMKTAYSLLINTVFYLMAITVLSGAIGKLLIEFGVVRLLEGILKPLMKPLYNLPGVAALGGIVTFLSDNPAIIGLAKDKQFSQYFKKYQLISLTNFGTAFGMGFVVVIMMTMAGSDPANGVAVQPGYFSAAMIGLLGAVVGSIVSTRLMQYFILKSYPNYKNEPAWDVIVSTKNESDTEDFDEKKEGLFMRFLNAILDGGKTGVEVGLSIIPGVLIITTFVIMLTNGLNGESSYNGSASQGIEALPFLVGKINIIFEWLFGFQSPDLIAFPLTALGSVGAALGLVEGPNGLLSASLNPNAIAVCTAIGMCWSGYLSTHTAMLDALGYRKLTSKAIISHTVGGLFAGIAAHWIYVGLSFAGIV